MTTEQVVIEHKTTGTEQVIRDTQKVEGSLVDLENEVKRLGQELTNVPKGMSEATREITDLFGDIDSSIQAIAGGAQAAGDIIGGAFGEALGVIGQGLSFVGEAASVAEAVPRLTASLQTLQGAQAVVTTTTAAATTAKIAETAATEGSAIAEGQLTTARIAGQSATQGVILQAGVAAGAIAALAGALAFAKTQMSDTAKAADEVISRERDRIEVLNLTKEVLDSLTTSELNARIGDLRTSIQQQTEARDALIDELAELYGEANYMELLNLIGSQDEAGGNAAAQALGDLVDIFTPDKWSGLTQITAEIERYNQLIDESNQTLATYNNLSPQVESREQMEANIQTVGEFATSLEGLDEAMAQARVEADATRQSIEENSRAVSEWVQSLNGQGENSFENALRNQRQMTGERGQETSALADAIRNQRTMTAARNDEGQAIQKQIAQLDEQRATTLDRRERQQALEDEQELRMGALQARLKDAQEREAFAKRQEQLQELAEEGNRQLERDEIAHNREIRRIRDSLRSDLRQAALENEVNTFIERQESGLAQLQETEEDYQDERQESIDANLRKQEEILAESGRQQISEVQRIQNQITELNRQFQIERQNLQLQFEQETYNRQIAAYNTQLEGMTQGYNQITETAVQLSDRLGYSQVEAYFSGANRAMADVMSNNRGGISVSNHYVFPTKLGDIVKPRQVQQMIDEAGSQLVSSLSGFISGLG